jgi:circadian clock protein KaiB
MQYRFRLFIVGGNVGSAKAEPDLRAVLEARLPGDYELEVVDIVAQPERAREDQVMAAPTVIRLAPAPQRRAVGSLADPDKVAEALGLP